MRVQKIELRIGNVDESNKGLQPLTENKLYGYYEHPSLEEIATFYLNETASGTFMTFQSFVSKSLDVNEIYLTIVK